MVAHIGYGRGAMADGATTDLWAERQSGLIEGDEIKADEKRAIIRHLFI